MAFSTHCSGACFLCSLYSAGIRCCDLVVHSFSAPFLYCWLAVLLSVRQPNPSFKFKPKDGLTGYESGLFLLQVIVWDRQFKKYCYEYAKDQDKFFADFAAAFSKLMELGVPFPEGTKA